MSQEKHRLGVSKNNLVTRRIKMTQPDEQTLHTAMAEIDEMFGLDKIAFDQRKQVLSISYDAGKLGIEDFEKILDRYDLKRLNSWWQNYKISYYKFVDGNVKDNAKQEPWSCHMSQK